MFAAKIRRSLPLLLMGALLIVACLTPVGAEVVLQGVPGDPHRRDYGKR